MSTSPGKSGSGESRKVGPVTAASESGPGAAQPSAIPVVAVVEYPTMAEALQHTTGLGYLSLRRTKSGSALAADGEG
jgi:hypothetical protein